MKSKTPNNKVIFEQILFSFPWMPFQETIFIPRCQVFCFAIFLAINALWKVVIVQFKKLNVLVLKVNQSSYCRERIRSSPYHFKCCFVI